MSDLDILHAPPGVLTGPELEERLTASGWMRMPSPCAGFVRYRCPRHYTLGGPCAGDDGHPFVAFDPEDIFSVWYAVCDITRAIDRAFGEPTTTPPLPFVPWIGAERAARYVWCATCGTRAAEGTPVVRISNADGGGGWLCVSCARAVGEMAARIGGGS